MQAIGNVNALSALIGDVITSRPIIYFMWFASRPIVISDARSA
jgi:hypothetical protein